MSDFYFTLIKNDLGNNIKRESFFVKKLGTLSNKMRLIHEDCFLI